MSAVRGMKRHPNQNKGNPDIAKTGFQPGVSGNPGGKPKGTRNRLQGDFMRALADDFAENGREAIEICRAEKPQEYLRIIASLMPKELEVTRHFDDLTDDQLDAALVAVEAILAAKGADPGEGTEEGTEPAAGVSALPEAG